MRTMRFFTCRPGLAAARRVLRPRRKTATCRYKRAVRAHKSNTESARDCAAQENLAKLQADMAKRNQTLLALQADLEMASRESARRSEQVAALEESVAKLQVRRSGVGWGL